MKKALVFSGIVCLISIAMPSCKSHALCPAYGKEGNNSDNKKGDTAQARAENLAPDKADELIQRTS